MNNAIKIIIACIAISASAISAALTVQLVTSLQAGIIAAASGLCFHCSQYGLAIAARTLTASKITKVITWAITSTLIALSIFATVAFLESGYQAKYASKTQHQAAEQFRAIRAEVAQKRIELASQYQGFEYISKAARELDKIEIATPETSERSIPKSDLDQLIELTASATNANATVIRLTMFLAIGCLLDAIGILSLFYLFQKTETPYPQIVSTPETLKQPVSIVASLAKRIENGEFGDTPKQSEIVLKTGISKATVSRAFRLSTQNITKASFIERNE